MHDETVSQPLYDFQTMEIGQHTAKFFHIPIGVDGKGGWDTGLYFPQRIPAGQEFLVEHAAVEMPTPSGRGILRLVVGSKVYLSLPLELCAAASTHRRMGYKVELPLLIRPDVLFAATLEMADGMRYPIRVGVVLHGKMSRPTE